MRNKVKPRESIWLPYLPFQNAIMTDDLFEDVFSNVSINSRERVI